MRLIAFAILVLALVIAVVGWRATNTHTAIEQCSGVHLPYASSRNDRCGVPLRYAP